MDITKFYPSIDHNILKSIISRKIKDTKVLEILYEIIDSVNGINGIYGKGVPIGNYLSQYFANLYLTGFDHKKSRSTQGLRSNPDSRIA